MLPVGMELLVGLPFHERSRRMWLGSSRYCVGNQVCENTYIAPYESGTIAIFM
jgi:hypothetical protein